MSQFLSSRARAGAGRSLTRSDSGTGAPHLRRLPRRPPSPADAELKDAAGKAPTTADLAKGDPGGTITGTISDVPAADSKAGVTLPDVANQVGQNKIAANFIWTLVTGFLVMFMQAGFAMVESGLCRVKNANHTYMMNFFVYTCGLFAYWILGFAIQMGGAAGNSNLGGLQLTHRRAFHDTVRQDLGPIRPSRIFPVRPHLRRRRHGHLPL